MIPARFPSPSPPRAVEVPACGRVASGFRGPTRGAWAGGGPTAAKTAPVASTFARGHGMVSMHPGRRPFPSVGGRQLRGPDASRTRALVGIGPAANPSAAPLLQPSIRPSAARHLTLCSLAPVRRGLEKRKERGQLSLAPLAESLNGSVQNSSPPPRAPVPHLLVKHAPQSRPRVRHFTKASVNTTGHGRSASHCSVKRGEKATAITLMLRETSARHPRSAHPGCI
jgi:hypothetical protein